MEKTKKQTVLILSGLPSSGKSTFSKELIKSEPNKEEAVKKLLNLIDQNFIGKEELIREIEKNSPNGYWENGHYHNDKGIIIY